MMGRKSGKGCYIYTGEKGERPLNSGAADIFKKYSLEPVKEVGSDLDVQQRLVLRFVNEAVMCLQDGILKTPLEGLPIDRIFRLCNTNNVLRCVIWPRLVNYGLEKF